MEVQPKHLVEFLDRHKASLRSFSMEFPWFGPRLSGWRLVLLSLADGYKLENLDFSVYEQGDEFDLVGAKGSKSHVIKAISNALGRDLEDEYKKRQGRMQRTQGSVADPVSDEGNGEIVSDDEDLLVWDGF